MVGKSVHPERSHVIVVLLTAVYGTGQIFVPLVSGMLSNHTGSFSSALILSAVIVGVGGMLVLTGKIHSTKENFFTNHQQNKKVIVCRSLISRSPTKM